MGAEVQHYKLRLRPTSSPQKQSCWCCTAVSASASCNRPNDEIASLATMLLILGWIVVGVLLPSYVMAALMRPDLTILWRSATGLVHPCRAPLNFCDKSHVVPKEYHVQLRPECSLEEHWRRMGLDTANIVNITPKNPWFPTAYHAQGIDDSVLDAIRADIMVDMVKCHREWSASDGETRELVNTPWDELGGTRSCDGQHVSEHWLPA